MFAFTTAPLKHISADPLVEPHTALFKYSEYETIEFVMQAKVLEGTLADMPTCGRTPKKVEAPNACTSILHQQLRDDHLHASKTYVNARLTNGKMAHTISGRRRYASAFKINEPRPVAAAPLSSYKSTLSKS